MQVPSDRNVTHKTISERRHGHLSAGLSTNQPEGSVVVPARLSRFRPEPVPRARLRVLDLRFSCILSGWMVRGRLVVVGCRGWQVIVVSAVAVALLVVRVVRLRLVGVEPEAVPVGRPRQPRSLEQALSAAFKAWAHLTSFRQRDLADRGCCTAAHE